MELFYRASHACFGSRWPRLTAHPRHPASLRFGWFDHSNDKLSRWLYPSFEAALADVHDLIRAKIALGKELHAGYNRSLLTPHAVLVRPSDPLNAFPVLNPDGQWVWV